MNLFFLPRTSTFGAYTNQHEPIRRKRGFKYQVRVVCGLVILFMFLFVSGCSLEPEEFRNVQFVPVGEWSDGFGGNYTITKTMIKHDDGFDFYEFKGTIEAAVDFSRDSGVLIIKVISSETGVTPGSYIGVYYRGYTTSHAFLANAIDVSWAIIEEISFNDAEKAFTPHTVDTHVTHWGSGYTK